jgi:exportin-T
MESCVRYSSWFDTNQSAIPTALEAFVIFCHNEQAKVRSRAWYLFQRFVRSVRGMIGDIAETLVQSVSDLLRINAVATEEASGDNEDDRSSIGDEKDTFFESQLSLFEAIGCIASPSTLPVDKQVLIVRSITEPIMSDLQQHIEPAKTGNEQALAQVHHDIMALGSIAHGFTDWMPNVKAKDPPPAEVAEVFVRAGQAVLLALSNLSFSQAIRQSSRYSFARLLGGMGTQMFPQLPAWMDGLLSSSISKQESSYFLRLLGQVIFAFKQDIFAILDTVLGPLLSRTVTRLAEPSSGTDDQLQQAELQREFVSFILICFTNDVGQVFVSTSMSPSPSYPLPSTLLTPIPANQPSFGEVINVLENYVNQKIDNISKLAMSVFTHMVSTYGGPDIGIMNTPNGAPPPNSPTDGLAPAPLIAGFDHFVLNRFLNLTWITGINIRNPNGRALVQEGAALQQEIYKKTGQQAIERIRANLNYLGLAPSDQEVYFTKLRSDSKLWKDFYVTFVDKVLAAKAS